MNDPVLIAYGVKRRASRRNYWTRIGEAYPHEQGAGLTVVLNAVPPDGRIVLLEPDAAYDQRAAARAAKQAAKANREGRQ